VLLTLGFECLAHLPEVDILDVVAPSVSRLPQAHAPPEVSQMSVALDLVEEH
jgi:hypothetical protein